MKNKFIDKKNIIEYVKNNIDFFGGTESLICEELSDGNINYVYRLRDENSKKSLVIKKSDHFIRSSGRILDIKRSEIEKEALILKNKYAQGFCPEVLFYDKENSIIIMEDISNYKNLRLEFMKGNVYENFPSYISEFLSKSLIPTTDLVLSRKNKKESTKKFINPDMCDISEDLVFTEPYFDYKKRNIIPEGLEDYVRENLYENKILQKEVLILKDKFQNKSQALLHGDLHTGSIFIKEEGIKIIDTEFAFYGPMGYDYGNVWANLLFALARFLVLKKEKSLIKKMTKQIIKTINRSIEKVDSAYDTYVNFTYFKNEDFKKNYIKEIISDSFGYSGTEIIRRTVGDSKVIEISSLDNDKILFLDKILIDFGIFLIMNRENIDCGEDFIKNFHKILKKYGVNYEL